MTKKRTLALAVTLALAAWASSAGAASGTQIDAAIDKGLAYLSSSQLAGGNWNYGSYDPAATGAAAFAMLSQQAHWGANAATYQANVDKAIGYLLTDASGLTLKTVSTRNDGEKICPGGALTCNGIFWNAASNEDSYTTGLITPAIALYAAQKGPDTKVGGTSALKDMTWKEVAQGITNLWAASQSTANQGNRQGGWRYILGDSSYDSDMSTTQWGTISLIYSQSVGATTPSITKIDLAKWLTAVQAADGSACYQPGTVPCDHADTGGLLLSLNFLGKGALDEPVKDALAFLNDKWTQTASGTWYGNFGHPYAMWAEYKGLELNIGLDNTTAITNLRPGGCTTAGSSPTAPNTCNWWQDYNDWLVANQAENGSWDGYSYWTGTLATAFYLPILGGTEIPVPVPEPSTLALIGLCLLGIAGLRRRKTA